MPIPPRPRQKTYQSDGRTQKKEDTKLRLIDAAEHWFKNRGYDSVSVTEIAATAGVVPSLINTYFMGKAGLLYAVVQRHNAPQFAEIARADAAGGTALARLDRIIAVSAAMDLRHLPLCASLQALSWSWPPETEAQNAEDIRPFRAILARVLRDGIAAGEIRDVVVEDAVDMIWAIYTMGLRPAVFGQATPEACAARIQALLRSLLAAPVPLRASPG